MFANVTKIIHHSSLILYKGHLIMTKSMSSRACTVRGENFIDLNSDSYDELGVFSNNKGLGLAILQSCMLSTNIFIGLFLNGKTLQYVTIPFLKYH